MVVFFLGCKNVKQNEESNKSKDSSLLSVETKSKSSEAITKKVKVIDGQFYVKEQLIPVGCIAQLMTELNGDNVQAAIYLERNSMRGCLDANFHYPVEERVDNMAYTIDQKLTNHTYKITIKEVYNEGTLGASVDKIIIQFIEKPYFFNDGTKNMVLAIEKIGEW